MLILLCTILIEATHGVPTIKLDCDLCDKPKGATFGYVLVCLGVFIGIFVWFVGFCYFMDHEDPDVVIADQYKHTPTMVKVEPTPSNK